MTKQDDNPSSEMDVTQEMIDEVNNVLIPKPSEDPEDGDGKEEAKKKDDEGKDPEDGDAKKNKETY